MGHLQEIFARSIDGEGYHLDVLLDPTQAKAFDPNEPRDASGKWSGSGDGLGPKSEAYPNGFEPSDSVKDDLDYAQSGEQVGWILKHYGAEQCDRGGEPVDLYTTKNGEVIRWDGKDVSTSYWESAEEAANDLDPSDYFGDLEEQFNREFWDGVPGRVYHATDADNWESIQENGLEARNETRGLNNRNVGGAVFTTADLDETAAGIYGDTVIEIDLAAMKRDGLTPWASQEPDVVEATGREALAYMLGAEDYQYETSDPGSPNTVILQGSIPPKYLKRI